MSHPTPGLYDVSRELVVGNLSETHVSTYEMTPAACMDLQKKKSATATIPRHPPPKFHSQYALRSGRDALANKWTFIM